MSAVYVEQYGGFWKLTQDEWKVICQQGATGEGFVLPACRQLRNRPRWVHRSTGSERAHYWSSAPDKKLLKPLDWRKEDFQAELQNLEGNTDV